MPVGDILQGRCARICKDADALLGCSTPQEVPRDAAKMAEPPEEKFSMSSVSHSQLEVGLGRTLPINEMSSKVLCEGGHHC